MGIPLTRQDYEKAERLKAQGLTWPQVAERMGGRSWTSLTAMVSEIRKGKWRFARHQQRTMTEAMAALAESGWTPTEIATAFGLSVATVSARLINAGCDAEVRRTPLHL